MSVGQHKPKVGVQAVIIRDEQLLVVVKHYPEGTAHILPGGGQEHGETLAQALRRECDEELGVQVTVDRLLFVREYIGANHEHSAIDSALHLVNVVFACSVPATYYPQLGSRPDADQASVAWLPLAALEQYRFYPRALIPLLRRLPAGGTYVGDIN